MLVNHEEAASGNLARGLVEGLVTSIPYYQYAPHTHGTLVYGALLAPWYALFGSSMLAVKLLGLLFAAAGTALWCAVARRMFGARAAAWFALWWLLPPAALIRMQHLAWANHMESIAFIGAMVYVAQNLDEDRGNARRYAALGLIAGFASFFCLQAAPAAAAIAAVDLWERRGRALARWLWPGAPAFLLGFAPHFWAAAATDRVVDLTARQFEPLTRLHTLLRYVLVELFGYSMPALTVVACGCVATGFVWACREGLRASTPVSDRPGRRGLRLLAAYVVAFSAAFMVSQFAVTPQDRGVYLVRYAVTIAPPLMALAAWASARIPHRAAALLLAALAVGSIADQKPWAAAGRAVRQARDVGWAGELRCLRGDDVDVYLTTDAGFAWSHAANIRPGLAEAWPRLLSEVERVPPEWRRYGYEVMGWIIGPPLLDALDKRGIADADARLGAVRGVARHDVLRRFNDGWDAGALSVAPPIPAVAEAEKAVWYEGQFDEWMRGIQARTGELFRMEDWESTRARLLGLARPADDEEAQAAGWIDALGRLMGDVGVDMSAAESLARFTPYAPDTEKEQRFLEAQARGAAHNMIRRNRCYARLETAVDETLLRGALSERGVELQPRGALTWLVSTAPAAP